MTKGMTSLVLSMAVLYNHISWQEAFDASILEEKYSAARWGELPEVIEAQNAQSEEIYQAARFLNLLQSK